MSSAFHPSRADVAQRRAFEALLAAPPALRHKLAGSPHVVDGGALDPDIATGLKILGKLSGPELDERNVNDARHELAAESWMFSGQPTPVASVEEVTISCDGHPDGGIPALFYRPQASPVRLAGKFEASVTPTPMPLLIWYHGGGWVLGSPHTHDAVARAFCAGAEVAVLNVDYRLAPEHPFPAAVEDAVAAFHWAHEHADELGIDPDRIAVGGDSAGGNLSAVIAQETARDGGPTPSFQMLVVPVTDMTLPRSRSYELFSEGYFLTRANMDWYEANYLTGKPRLLPSDDIDTLRNDPRVSPLRATDLADIAARMPPAYVAVAGFDPLRDEGIAYAHALRAAGVQTTLRVHTDAVHPFINILATDLGRRCMAEAVGALRQAVGAFPSA